MKNKEHDYNSIFKIIEKSTKYKNGLVWKQDKSIKEYKNSTELFENVMAQFFRLEGYEVTQYYNNYIDKLSHFIISIKKDNEKFYLLYKSFNLINETDKIFILPDKNKG